MRPSGPSQERGHFVVVGGAKGGRSRGVQGSPCSWEEAGSFLLLLKLKVWYFNPNNLIPRFLCCHSHREK